MIVFVTAISTVVYLITNTPSRYTLQVVTSKS